MTKDQTTSYVEYLEMTTGLEWKTEYHFYPERTWRIDFAQVELKIAIEIEGGVFIRGRHSRGAGMVADMEKYNTMVSMGWRLLRFIPPKPKPKTKRTYTRKVRAKTPRMNCDSTQALELIIQTIENIGGVNSKIAESVLNEYVKNLKERRNEEDSRNTKDKHRD